MLLWIYGVGLFASLRWSNTSSLAAWRDLHLTPKEPKDGGEG